MKALVFHEPERISVDDVAEPSPGPGEVLVRMAAAAICHSDIRVYKGLKHAEPGVIPGHEIAGVVAELGEGVKGIAVGDRVVVCPIVACGRCHFCLLGKRHRCLERVTLGYDINGGLAEYLLAPAQIVSLGHLLPVPEGLPMQRACLTEPLACVLNSVETCELRAGSSVAIVGAGPMGILHLLLMRQLGAGTIVMSDPDEARAETARRMGADLVIDPREESLADVMKARTGGLGADAVVVTPGLAEAMEGSLDTVRAQGVVTLFGGFPPGTRVSLDPNIVHNKEIKLTGSQNASLQQYRQVLDLLPQMPQIDEVSTHRFPLVEATQSYEVRLRGEGLKSMVVMGD
ncbi:MAG: alcohol dehydrogenase catalytic domain-containing protein [Chloroflexi bacterium]|nr:alcohol dehydrogenase catalytic domain-containing protein [Chloroflexota bacterium]MCH8007613.1 alcohol dehydrogenase catalytic domain-containing protein [Chloroflexota bacterium]